MLRLTATLVAIALTSAFAQEVEVTSVRFSRVQAPNGAPGNWLEADVALTVRPSLGVPGQTVNRVRVALLTAFEGRASAASERQLEHYRGEAECVALESGRSNVRFYLPPEIVRRDQVYGEPKYWAVEVSAGGRPVLPGRASQSSSLATAGQRTNFHARGGAAAAANDGILVPQYLSPFANEYPRATPSFVRRQPR
jgi:hypothetical protein